LACGDRLRGFVGVPTDQAIVVRHMNAVDNPRAATNSTTVRKDFVPPFNVQALDQQRQVDDVRFVEALPIDPDLGIQHDLAAGEMLTLGNAVFQPQFKVVDGFLALSPYDCSDQKTAAHQNALLNNYSTKNTINSSASQHAY